MAHMIGLQLRQVFLAAGEPAAFAQARFCVNLTNTQVPVYSDVTLLSERFQPVPCDANGVLPPCYIGTVDPIRIILTTEDDVAIDGYPMDHVAPLPAEQAAASTIGFTPTDAVPETNVQDAIEHVAGLFTDQGDLVTRPLTPFVTGGSGNAYTLTPSPAITAYANGQTFLVRPNRTSQAGAVTLDVNGLGPRNLQVMNASGAPVALQTGAVQAWHEFLAFYDGTRFLMTLGRDNPITVANADGIATRYSDGTQVCTKTLTGQGPASTVYEALFSSANITTGNWALPFTSRPRVSVSIFNPSGSTAWPGCATPATATAGPTVLILRAATSAATDYIIDITATGRWF